MDFNIKNAIKDRKEGMSLRDLGEKYHKSPSTIKKYLNINDIDTSYKKILDEEIVDLYVAGRSCNDIGKILGVNAQRINYRLNKMGKIRTLAESMRNRAIKHSFFSNFSINSCYWAGFIAADGNICKGCLKIELSKKDIGHLAKFGTVIGYNRKIKKYKNSRSIAFRSKEMNNDLATNFNIIPKKSLILEPPLNIPQKFINSFVRGYIDGDGSYFYSDKDIGLEIAGTYKMLSWIKKNFEKSNNIGNPKIRQKGNIYILRYVGNKQVPNIVQWLFKNCTINTILDRKFNKIKKFL